MNDFSNNVPEYRLPTVEEIINFSVDSIYKEFDTKEKIKHEEIIKYYNKITKKFFLPIKISNSRKLFNPTYWNLLNYISVNLYPPNSKPSELYCMLKLPLPPKQQFKEEIKRKYNTYLEENLKIIQFVD